MNINIPPVEALVRLEFMNQLDQQYVGQYVECQIFAVAAIPAQTPLFHFICPDGGIWWRMPIHAFCWKQCKARDLTDLALWDSFSYHVTCFTVDLFRNKRIQVTRRDQSIEEGQYMFTLDWFGGNFAEVPGQHKSGHVIRLDDGNFAIQPNNRIRLFDPNFTVSQNPIPRKIAKHLFSSEGLGKWTTNPPESLPTTFSLTDLRKGLHDEMLRELGKFPDRKNPISIGVRDILIDFCLSKNLIQLNQNEPS